jgi:hypothetical protein
MPTSNNVNAPWQPRPGQGVADNAGGLFSKMLGYDDQSGEFDFNSDKLNLYSPAQTTGFLSKAKQQLETSNQQVQQGAAMSGGARGAAGPDLASINQQQTDAANRGALAGLNFDIHNAGVEQGRGLLDTLAPLVDSAKNRETDLALAGFRMTPGAMQAQDLTWEDAFPLFQQHGGEWDAVDAQGNVFKKDAAGQIVEFDGVTPLSLEKLQDPMQVRGSARRRGRGSIRRPRNGWRKMNWSSITTARTCRPIWRRRSRRWRGNRRSSGCNRRRTTTSSCTTSRSSTWPTRRRRTTCNSSTSPTSRWWTPSCRISSRR